jgi:preprotein translocase subunit SecE
MGTKKTESDEAAKKADPGKTPGRGAAKVQARQAGAKGETPPASAVRDRIERAREFYEQARVELKKVTWPTRKETVNTGVAVLILVLVMSVFLGLVDLGLARLIEFILA